MDDSREFNRLPPPNPYNLDMRRKDLENKSKRGTISERERADLDRMYRNIDKAEREAAKKAPTTRTEMGKVFKKGGSVKSSASRRADGIAQRGKTKGRII